MILITTGTTIRKWAGNDHQLQFANAINNHKEQMAKSSENIFCLIYLSDLLFVQPLNQFVHLV